MTVMKATVKGPFHAMGILMICAHLVWKCFALVEVHMFEPALWSECDCWCGHSYFYTMKNT